LTAPEPIACNEVVLNDAMSQRFVNLAAGAFLVRYLFPSAPDWLMTVAVVAAIVGLVFMLRDQIAARTAPRSETAMDDAYSVTDRTTPT
jgi:hypothetical protein